MRSLGPPERGGLAVGGDAMDEGGGVIGPISQDHHDTRGGEAGVGAQ